MYQYWSHHLTCHNCTIGFGEKCIAMQRESAGSDPTFEVPPPLSSPATSRPGQPLLYLSLYHLLYFCRYLYLYLCIFICICICNAQGEWWIWPNLWSGSPLLSLPDQVSPSTLHCFRTHFKTLDVSYCTALGMWVLYFHRQVNPCTMPGLQNSLNPAIPDWRTWSKFGEHG